MRNDLALRPRLGEKRRATFEVRPATRCSTPWPSCTAALPHLGRLREGLRRQTTLPSSSSCASAGEHGQLRPRHRGAGGAAPRRGPRRPPRVAPRSPRSASLISGPPERAQILQFCCCACPIEAPENDHVNEAPPPATPSFDPFRKDLLAGKTTIITGGGTGLGRSMALRMAGLGAKVAVLGRRPEPLRETAQADPRRGRRRRPLSPATCATPRRCTRAVRRRRGGAGAGEPAHQQRRRQLPRRLGGPLARTPSTRWCRSCSTAPSTARASWAAA